jgi:hypothetical protein
LSSFAASSCVERLVLVNTVFDRSPQERAAVEARVREDLSGGHESGIAAALERCSRRPCAARGRT